MNIKKLILTLLTLTLTIVLCACGNQSNTNDRQLSGTYSYEKAVLMVLKWDSKTKN